MPKSLRLEVAWTKKHQNKTGCSPTSGYTFPPDTRHHGEMYAEAWAKAGHKVTKSEK